MPKERVERDEEDLVRLYLTDIGQYPLLTKDGEVTLAKEPILAYGQAVHEATDRYLATLTQEELDKPMQLGPRTGTVAELLSILVVHNLTHGGEISALKGFQGLQGQPV